MPSRWYEVVSLGLQMLRWRGYGSGVVMVCMGLSCLVH